MNTDRQESDRSGRYDAIVLGGGLAGLATALALADRDAGGGLRVVLVDADGLDKWRNAGFDGRASAITATSEAVLDRLGVWPLLAGRTQTMADIKVTDTRPDAAGRPVLLRFDARTPDGRAAAHMIENRHLGAALAERVLACGGIDVKAPARAAAFDCDAACARLTLEDGRMLEAPVAIAADGRASWLRGQAGIRTVGWAYDQSGIVATVAHERPHRGIAEEHFMPAGPFAILPLPGNRSSLVWTEETAEARRITDLDDAGFARELARRFSRHLGTFEVIGPRWCYPLSMQLATDYAAPRVALVGDAAHVVHPLAGLGFNLGLRDVAALAETVVEAMRIGLDPGSVAVLERYTAWRRPDNVATALAMDGMNRLFSNDNPALKALRDAGLGMVDRIEPLKSMFIGEAAGLGSDAPRLMQGKPI